MSRSAIAATLALASLAAVLPAHAAMSDTPHTSPAAPAAPSAYDLREQDWRNGAIVYQVLVDRFAPAADLDAKRALYPAPKRLRAWNELPTAGAYVPSAQVYQHEIDFWGGDLRSLAGRLDYVRGLGVDVLYLNPIQLAYTNHKYDALDYQQISPEYGTRADLKALAGDVHRDGMKLVLDGVFNHMGRNAPIFQDAFNNPDSRWRHWFEIGPPYPGGARVWGGAQNLPELNLENPAVRDHLWQGPDSVVRSFLRDGADGWRLDVAYDIGPRWLAELTAAAHAEKPGSLTVGEIWSYPQAWFPSLDGVMNFTLREILLRSARGEIGAATASEMIARVVADTGVDHLLKSWLMLDNHDTARLATTLPDAARRHLAQVLQFTLPGSPNLYYGSELGMTGGADPEMRAPMRWDLATAANPELAWTRRLIALRRSHRALRVGDFRRISSERLIAFERHTDRVADAVMVFANPADHAVTDTVMVPDSMLMNMAPLRNLLTPQDAPPPMIAGLMTLSLPAHGVLLLQPDVAPRGGYTPYKRIP